ncbi:MAG TPA: LytTR family DNA-binding domain-containing protein [Novosphingobium sp.]|nr:LytTR family DNA-binding domain-containing protein [Novosphingobium sp.]
MIWLRRALLELWAMVVLAVVVGFLGPFGTYLEADFPMRVWNWLVHLMGAYVLVRPTISFLMALAAATSLPRNALLGWGVVLASFPLALVWQWGASVFFHGLGGFAGLLPFAFLSATAILTVVLGARRIDEGLRRSPAAPEVALPSPDTAPQTTPSPIESDLPAPGASGPRLRARLAPSFEGPVLALQSEDHYVRVHGMKASPLLLMRLRDAIAEMDGCEGQQVHRSWWVAREGIASIEAEGRNRTIVLRNGGTAPVARESIPALERSGFLRSGPLTPRYPRSDPR